MSVKLLTEQRYKFLSLNGGCTCLYESTLVKMPHRWKSRVTAQLCFQIDAPSRKTYTFDEVISRTERLAAGLQCLGAQSGDVICTFAPNHIDYITVAFATYLVNGILQCINPLFTKGKSLLLLNRNCLGQLYGITWNQTSDAHRGSTLIT